MSQLSFSQELVNAVVRYLSSRPYAEVAGLLDRMNQEAEPQLKAAKEAANAPQEQETPPTAPPSTTDITEGRKRKQRKANSAPQESEPV
jgi:hypothetical protein